MKINNQKKSCLFKYGFFFVFGTLWIKNVKDMINITGLLH